MLPSPRSIFPAAAARLISSASTVVVSGRQLSGISTRVESTGGRGIARPWQSLPFGAAGPLIWTWLSTKAGQKGALAKVDDGRAGGHVGDIAHRSDHAGRAIFQQNGGAANPLRSDDPVRETRAILAIIRYRNAGRLSVRHTTSNFGNGGRRSKAILSL